MGAKPLWIRFDKIDAFVKIYDGIRYLTLYDYEKYNVIYDRIRYLINKMVSEIVLMIILQESELIHITLYLIDKILTCHVIILIKSVVSKNKYDYYYNKFLEKGLYKDKSNTQYF